VPHPRARIRSASATNSRARWVNTIDKPTSAAPLAAMYDAAL
jgi:hypothetical protein